MTTKRLLWGMTWRGALYGLTIGTCVSAVYGLLIAGAGFFIGLFVGLVFGPSIGLVGGFIMGILSRLFFFPIKNPASYDRVAGIVSVIYINIVWVIVYCLVSGFLFSAERSDSYSLMFALRIILDFSTFSLVLFFLPALVASLSAFFISHRMADWYKRESREGTVQNVTSN